MASIPSTDKNRLRLNELREYEFDLVVAKSVVSSESLTKSQLIDKILEKWNNKSLNELIEYLVNVCNELNKADPNLFEIVA